MTNKDAIQLIFRMYRFESPVPVEMQRIFLDSSKKNLIVILKKFGKCGTMTIGAINLLYAMKKFGISLTMTKAYIVLMLASAGVAGVVVAASIVTTHFVFDNRSPEINQPMNVDKSADPLASQESPVVQKNASQSAKSDSPLKKLHNTYRHVEKVYLKDGTVLTGVVHERNGGVDLITPEGTLDISRDDIGSIEYLNPGGL
ncbi:MAG TPA: hypothetical protein VF857_11200 [Spirochaetota bacterium]